jgi:hypothetical protein
MGDANNLGLWIALFFVSDGTFIGATVYKPKKSYKE